MSPRFNPLPAKLNGRLLSKIDHDIILESLDGLAEWWEKEGAAGAYPDQKFLDQQADQTRCLRCGKREHTVNEGRCLVCGWLVHQRCETCRCFAPHPSERRLP